MIKDVLHVIPILHQQCIGSIDDGQLDRAEKVVIMLGAATGRRRRRRRRRQR